MLPLTLATAAFAAGTGGLDGLALWLCLFAIPGAAAAAFVSVSDVLEGRPSRLRAWTSGFALAFLVLGSAARSNAAVGAATPRLATWALLAVLLAYSTPVVAWVLEPVKVARQRPERRRGRRPAEAVVELDRAA